jgi:streptogramin lyase
VKKLTAIIFLVFLMMWMNGRPAQADKVYTTDADFDKGNLIFVNHDDPPGNDQLQPSKAKDDDPFVNVAASRWNTLIRIDANTGEILGEYRTAPEGCVSPWCVYPSRTTVDHFGNVWVSNRNESGDIGGVPHGSVVKIGLVIGGDRVNSDGASNPDGDYLAPPFEYGTCVDRDGDGLIKTSRGQGDVRPWPDITYVQGGIDGIVEDADDECILIYQRLPDGGNAHHVSVDANNDVWVGGYPPKMLYKLDGDTGEILDSFDARDFGCGGYGGLIDGSGILWSASPDENSLLRYDPSTHTGTCIPVSGSSGLGVDTNGFIWNSMGNDNSIVKISPTGVIQSGFPKTTEGGSGDLGVAVTPEDDNVWVANSSFPYNVSRLDNDGNVRKVITVGNRPTGVAIDFYGKVWVTNFASHDVTRIDPNLGGDVVPGAVDLIISLGFGAYPDNYSNMTGLVANGTTSPRGTWTVIHDFGDSPCTGEVTITWNTEPEAYEPEGSRIIVEARASDTAEGLRGEMFQEVSNGVVFDGLVGQFIEVRATLKAASDEASPVLSDLAIKSEPPNKLPNCSEAFADPGCLWPPNHKFVDVNIMGVTDPDGDPVTIDIVSITSDEATASEKGSGGKKHAPDGSGIGSKTASVRAERSGKGDGRVYVIDFTASDGEYGVCEESVIVKVPHDQSAEDCPAVDSGQNYDATEIN